MIIVLALTLILAPLPTAYLFPEYTWFGMVLIVIGFFM